MLAAFGFAYNALKGGIDAASDLGNVAGNKTEVEGQWAVLDRGVRTAGGLAALAFLIFAILAKPAWNEVEDAIRLRFSVHHYSALDIIFVLLTVTWLAIAIGLGEKARSLAKKKGDYPLPT